MNALLAGMYMRKAIYLMTELARLIWGGSLAGETTH